MQMNPRSVLAGGLALVLAACGVSPPEEREGAFQTLRRERPIPFFQERELIPELPAGRGFYGLTRHADILTASRKSELFCSGQGTKIP